MTLRILGLIAATVVAFMALGILENWELFGGTWAGEEMLPAAPPMEEVEAVIREARQAQQEGRAMGAAWGPARRASEADLAYRAAQGITQTLDHGRLELGEIGFTGPDSFQITARETLDLGLARAGGAMKRFRLSGTWRYELHRTPEGLVLFDVQPLDVEVQPIVSRPADGEME
ncbi:MAG: hypothetical protein P1V51_24635 [Deltaproteobacteria bacterium]|nr:hypothetical protein [Deltaproteobacteria bacterium]